MNTYLYNSKGKKLFNNPESIKKASRRRYQKKPIGIALKKYDISIAAFKRTTGYVTA